MPVRAAPRQEIGERQRRAGERRQRSRIDVDEGALARQHEAGAGKPRTWPRIRQGPQISELPARMNGDDAAGQPGEVDAREAGIAAIMSAKRSGVGNLRIDSTR